MESNHVVYLIMAGGNGMRLWPMSRSSFPKQLHSLLGQDSLLQQTISRALGGAGDPGQILIGTREDLYFSVKDQWDRLKLGAQPWLLLEPLSRNTAPAIALAVLACRERFGRDVTMVTLAADHLIKDHVRFRTLVNTAVTAARQGKIVTFGIVPSYPETGYGYIKMGAEILPQVHAISQFKEKPTPEKARQFCRSADYVWNSGMFVFDTAVMGENLQRLSPEVWKAVTTLWNSRQQKNGRVSFSAQQFGRLPNISIDYAVMERTPDSAVIKAEFGWCDVGCWQMVHAMSAHDKDGNTLSGNIVALDTSNSFIRTEKRFVAAVGVKDMVVIDTPDALLLTPVERSQDVKKIVEKLDEQHSSLTKFHTTVYRPWGNYTVLEEGPGYLIKRVVVNPGQTLSLQKHLYRSEHWVVISGDARVISGDDSLLLKPNESYFIPRGRKHRLINPRKKDLVIIEVQTGTKLVEEDIIRYDDVYERVPRSRSRR